MCFDLSTNLPSTVKLLAERAAERGVTFLDSPVSNGVQGAIDANLAVMVGGDKAAFDKYRPVLECIGNNVFHMGELGMGALTKIVNNMVSIATMQVLIEATVIAEAGGLDAQQAYEVMNVASAQQLRSQHADTAGAQLRGLDVLPQVGGQGCLSRRASGARSWHPLTDSVSRQRHAEPRQESRAWHEVGNGDLDIGRGGRGRFALDAARL